MNRDQVKDYAKSKIIDYLKSKGVRNLNNHFRCLNPHHSDNNPSMSYDKKRQKIHCFSCYADYDIFDLIAIEYGLIDNKEIFAKTYDWCGITLDFKYEHNSFLQTNNNGSEVVEVQNQEITDQDYLTFFKLAQTNVSDVNFKNYISKRGISDAIAKEYGLGYIKDWKSPKALKEHKNPPATSRVIIPTSKYSYVARDTMEVLSSSRKAFDKMKEGNVNIFNIKALEKTEFCFVTEGEFDALSFLELGYNALSLGSISNIRLFLTKLKEVSICCPLILAFDSDASGMKATVELCGDLKQLGITFFTAEIYKSFIGNNDYQFTSQLYENYKDANEFLVKDKVGFKNKIDEFIFKLEDEISKDVQIELKEIEMKKSEYLNRSVNNHISELKNRINLSVNSKIVSTGFKNLDATLDGGLYDALYVIGAISSLGKTTFTIQIADHLSSQGHDVLFISLEMSMYEIMAKSISRETLLQCKKHNYEMCNAKTTRGIMVGSRYFSYSNLELDIIYHAEERYKKISERLWIVESSGDIGVKKIRQLVGDHKKYTSSTPIVIIDYLQILSYDNERLTDKQNVDKNISALKLISRDFKTPVLAISSLNRQGYKDQIAMESFKESGAIEYSSDVLMGLQLKGVGNGNFNVDTAKLRDPRDVELKILKNRNGVTGSSLEFQYYPKYNYFRENR